jgi:hypothetical protein
MLATTIQEGYHRIPTTAYASRPLLDYKALFLCKAGKNCGLVKFITVRYGRYLCHVTFQLLGDIVIQPDDPNLLRTRYIVDIRFKYFQVFILPVL